MKAYSRPSSRRLRAGAPLCAAGVLLTAVVGCGGGGAVGGGGGRITPPPADQAATLTVGAAGSRGVVPLKLQADGASGYRGVQPGAPLSQNMDLSDTVQVSAPEVFGDRQFVRWQAGDGRELSASASLTARVGDLGPAPGLTAVYQPRPAGADGTFAPNFYSRDLVGWKSFPVKVYFHHETMNPGVVDKLRSGFDRWVAATGGLVSYEVVQDPAHAQITVRLGDAPAGKLGYCEANWWEIPNVSRHLTDSHITIRSAMQFSSPRGQSLETVAAHEFGHALGMIGPGSDTGHSSDRADTMYPMGNDDTGGIITARDLNTLASAYPGLFSPSRAAALPQPVSAEQTPAGGRRGSTRAVCEDATHQH